MPISINSFQLEQQWPTSKKQLSGRGPGKLRATAEEPEARPRRTMSAAARKRIADAQKRRWATYKKQKAVP
jgi:hypothetical protein